VKKLEDLFVGHVRKATRLSGVNFGNGITIIVLNVMSAAKIIQPWTILNIWVSTHGNYTLTC